MTADSKTLAKHYATPLAEPRMSVEDHAQELHSIAEWGKDDHNHHGYNQIIHFQSTNNGMILNCDIPHILTHLDTPAQHSHIWAEFQLFYEEDMAISFQSISDHSTPSCQMTPSFCFLVISGWLTIVIAR